MKKMLLPLSLILCLFFLVSCNPTNPAEPSSALSEVSDLSPFESQGSAVSELSSEESSGVSEITSNEAAPSESASVSREATTNQHQHSYKTKVVDATCTKGGYTLHECSCGKSYKSEQTSAMGHDWGEWSVKTAATSSKAGVKIRQCKICQTTETKSYTNAEEEDYPLKSSKNIACGPNCELGTTYGFKNKNANFIVQVNNISGKEITVTKVDNWCLHVVYNINGHNESFDVRFENNTFYIQTYSHLYCDIFENGTYQLRYTTRLH